MSFSRIDPSGERNLVGGYIHVGRENIELAPKPTLTAKKTQGVFATLMSWFEHRGEVSKLTIIKMEGDKKIGEETYLVKTTSLKEAKAHLKNSFDTNVNVQTTFFGRTVIKLIQP